jgi:hypothetical protein
LERRKVLITASFILLAIPASFVLAILSANFLHRHHFATLGDMAAQQFVHGGLESLGTSIEIEAGVNAACWFAILIAVFMVVRHRRGSLVILLLTLLTAVFAWHYYDTTLRSKRLAEYKAAQPALIHLPPVQPRNIREALVMEPIMGYQPECETSGAMGGPPSFVRYKMDYGTAASGTCANLLPVHVRIEQHPNRARAEYKGRFDPKSDPSSVKRVSKDGNFVLVTTQTVAYTGNLDYFWVSNDSVVTLSFERAAQDASLQNGFLKVYLRRYPSSL